MNSDKPTTLDSEKVPPEYENLKRKIYRKLKGIWILITILIALHIYVTILYINAVAGRTRGIYEKQSNTVQELPQVMEGYISEEVNKVLESQPLDIEYLIDQSNLYANQNPSLSEQYQRDAKVLEIHPLDIEYFIDKSSFYDTGNPLKNDQNERDAEDTEGVHSVTPDILEQIWDEMY